MKIKKGKLVRTFAAATAILAVGFVSGQQFDSHVMPHGTNDGLSGALDGVGDAFKLQANVKNYLPSQIVPLLENGKSRQDLLTVLDAAQPGIDAALKDTETTDAEKENLKKLENLLGVARPLVENGGSIPATDLPAVLDIYNNQADYTAALVSLYSGFKDGSPATKALVEAVTSDPQAMQAVENLLPKVMNSFGAKAAALPVPGV